MSTYASESGGACDHCNLALGHHEHLTAKCPPHKYLSAEAAVVLGGRPNVCRWGLGSRGDEHHVQDGFCPYISAMTRGRQMRCEPAPTWDGNLMPPIPGDTHREMSERDAAVWLGERIGYGRMMQLAEKLWRERLETDGLDGGEHAAYCCASFLVSCACIEQGTGPVGCDWCCGAGRVTKLVHRVQLKLMDLGKDPGPYCQPEMVAAREAPAALVCVDEECDLSGGFAHVGPCEPCGCELRHAVEECPDARPA